MSPAPSLNIPHSTHTVEVSIIDTTTSVNGLPVAAFMQPQIPGYSMIVDGCSFSFLIKHHNPNAPSKYDNLLFDLGARKDFENGPTVLMEQAKAMGFGFSVEKDVATILKENSANLADIGAIIWSHYHADHTGDPSTFPTTTALIVGPGFKAACIPAWPTKQDSQLDEKAWEGRELREINFDADGLTLGQYRAVDFYGDGSFYLLDSPGHATGHMCALARTSADPPEFMLLGGDVAHHGGEFRPTEYLPLPEDLRPNPLVAAFEDSLYACPGALFHAVHPNKSSTEPFMEATGFFHEDTKAACDSVRRLFDFDAQDYIFTVIAHDKSLKDVVDFYPKSAVDWKKLGWKKHGTWRFLRDFDVGGEDDAFYDAEAEVSHGVEDDVQKTTSVRELNPDPGHADDQSHERGIPSPDHNSDMGWRGGFGGAGFRGRGFRGAGFRGGFGHRRGQHLFRRWPLVRSLVERSGRGRGAGGGYHDDQGRSAQQ